MQWMDVSEENIHVKFFGLHNITETQTGQKMNI